MTGDVVAGVDVGHGPAPDLGEARRDGQAQDQHGDADAEDGRAGAQGDEGHDDQEGQQEDRPQAQEEGGVAHGLPVAPAPDG